MLNESLCCNVVKVTHNVILTLSMLNPLAVLANLISSYEVNSSMFDTLSLTAVSPDVLSTQHDRLILNKADTSERWELLRHSTQSLRLGMCFPNA